MNSPYILFIDFCFKPCVIIILFTESSFENCRDSRSCLTNENSQVLVIIYRVNEVLDSVLIRHPNE